jgi:hypothetical protein
MDRVGNVMVPKYTAKTLLYYYQGSTHVGLWRIGEIDFILDTTITDECLYYSIIPVRKGPSYPPEENVVVPERDLRSLK